jgi:hypothetical protein
VLTKTQGESGDRNRHSRDTWSGNLRIAHPHKYDDVLLLDLIEGHSITVH